MPARPSPNFSINGGAVGAKASVAAGATVTATISDIAGVAPVTWSVVNTDDTTVAASYTLTPSGSVNQVCTTTALTAGTAAELQCTVAGGVDPTTGYPSALMTTSVKFFVPTAEGLEVMVAGELEDDNRLASSTHGGVVSINAAIRGSGGTVSLLRVPVLTSGQSAGGGAIDLINHPIANGQVAYVTATITARDTVTGDSAGYRREAVFEQTAGVLAIVGGTAVIVTREEDVAWDADLSIAANTIVVHCTGDAANAVNWGVRAEIVILG